MKRWAKLLPLFDFERLAPERQREFLAGFRARMGTRRIVRHFSDEPVPFELVAGAAAVAGSAPPDYLLALEPFGTDWHKPLLEIAPYFIVVSRQDCGVDEQRPGVKIKHCFVRRYCNRLPNRRVTHRGSGHAHSHARSHWLPGADPQSAPQRGALSAHPDGYPSPDSTAPDISKKTIDESLIHHP